MERILIVNKFYYNRGGDCVCAINLEKLLREKGHEVAVFAMQYDENMQSEYAKYFASNVEFSGGIGAKLNAAKRIFGMGSIKKEFVRILKDFAPDVVHLHNIHSYLSPIVAKLAKEYGAKVVWTLHDYKLLCPSYACTRDDLPCELCYKEKSYVLKHKCMKGNLVASTLAYLEAKYWNKSKLEKYTDIFVCPSKFMKSRMELGGFEKLKVVCNFVDPVKLDLFKQQNVSVRGDYYIYVGRLSQEKGVITLINVAKTLPYKLKVVGGGPLEGQLKNLCAESNNIEFVGHQDAITVARLLASAKFAVVPSECYENNPLSVIEALCAGTPVVGAKMGGIPELIDGNKGIIFESRNEQMLKQVLVDAYIQEWQYEQIKEFALKEFSPMSYYDKVMSAYSCICNK